MDSCKKFTLAVVLSLLFIIGVARPALADESKEMSVEILNEGDREEAMGISEHAKSAAEHYLGNMVVAVVNGDPSAGIQAEIERNRVIIMNDLGEAIISFKDLVFLSKIIYLEAGSAWLDDEWKMAVGEVLLNRRASPEFPDTLEECVYQTGQYYSRNDPKFRWVLPTIECVNCALRLLKGERVLNDPAVVYQANFKQGGGTALELHDAYLGDTFLCYSVKRCLYVDDVDKPGDESTNDLPELQGLDKM